MSPLLIVGQPALTSDPEDLYDEGHWTEAQSQSVRPSGGQISSAPAGVLEVVPQATLRLQNIPPGKILSLDQAIHFSIDCACECIYYMYFSSASLMSIYSRTNTHVYIVETFASWYTYISACYRDVYVAASENVLFFNFYDCSASSNNSLPLSSTQPQGR